MSNNFAGRHGRALSRLATSAIAVTLLGATAGTAVAADGPSAAQRSAKAAAVAGGPATAAVRTGSAPVLPINAADYKGALDVYGPNGKGGIKALKKGKKNDGWNDYKAVAQVHSSSGGNFGFFFLWKDGLLVFADKYGYVNVGSHMDYDLMLSPGDLGGSENSGLLARDKSGVMWYYQGKYDGSVKARKRVGGGWGQYTEIVGRGDLTGDGKADIVARDKQGVLWLYKGTGKADKPFAGRTKIGGGWNQYTKLITTGDIDGDGRSDLLAVDKKGALWLYKGTGKASSPFKSRVKVANSGWDKYRLVF
ncbi:FG-GAP repeat domain-containing protein [Streptomyces orinoci]|uniref:VCBS repeat-containing protein n=1 Tax=Streptomyces orinoci TaxID=67339 RepID=A0ABV3K4Y7_STRON|nr:VCBS repeat-containing protein [Streptomyces orinoci]